jgi:hypothetical protein
MTVRIIEDVEEALAREVRRISFHETRTATESIFREAFDPLTGEIVQLPIQASFYDSSADASHISYPHFFISLLSSREDIYSNRVIPQYGNQELCGVATSPKAFEQVLYLGDGTIIADGNDVGTSTFRINRVEPGFLLRILSGTNIGTYIIDSVSVSNISSHTITVSNNLVEELPSLSFNSNSRVVSFVEPLDLSTIRVGDIFEDSTNQSFNITAIDYDKTEITIDGVGVPNLAADSLIRRVGDVLQFDPNLVVFTVLDPSKPVTTRGGVSTSESVGYNPQVPIDLFYLIRIDSREKDDHTAITNRIWEDFFNPPRTALPVIVRTKLSAEKELVADLPPGGSNTLNIGDNSKYSVGEKVLIFDDLLPTKSETGGFTSPFDAKIVGKLSTDQVVLDKVVPDTFTVSRKSKIVSNADYRLFMFHFVDHKTRNVEGAQYWVHEFQAIIQVWKDRQGEPKTFEGGPVQSISTPIEYNDCGIIIDD